MFDDFRPVDPEALSDALRRRTLPATVYEMLESAADRYGDREAWHFIDTGTTRTWAAVLEMVDRAAEALSRMGIGEGSHVGVMAWNVEPFPVIWLALSRLGGVLVPINARYTADEIVHALDSADVEYLFVENCCLSEISDDVLSRIPAPRIASLGADPSGRFRDWPGLIDAADGRHAPRAAPDPARLLNLQFTSGTTGMPKACMLSNHYWVVIGHSGLEILATEIERFYASLSFFYMVPQRLLANAMAGGGAIVFPYRPSARNFIPDIVKYDCDYGVPMLAVAKEPDSALDRAHRVKIAMSGLGNLSTGEQGRFHRRFGIPLQNIYGMTEYGMATYVPAHRIAELEDTGTIGVPAPLREVSIRSPAGVELPTGIVGEICVRGDGMMAGYYGLPEATEAAFHGDWFRTGDLGHVDRRGLYFLDGRIKDMVRRGAENISASEVEAVLRLLPQVQEAAIVAVPDPHTEEEVKAYIQLRVGERPEETPPKAIFDHCALHLAPFKIPRYIEYRDSLPLTETARVRKKTLLAEKTDLRIGSFDRRLGEWR